MNFKTKRGMRKLAAFVNKEVFANTLDLKAIEFKPVSWLECHGLADIHDMPMFWGLTLQMELTDYELFVCVAKDLPKQQFYDILVHELIHIWQIQNNEPCNHGRKFDKWCEKAYNILYHNLNHKEC